MITDSTASESWVYQMLGASMIPSPINNSNSSYPMTAHMFAFLKNPIPMLQSFLPKPSVAPLAGQGLLNSLLPWLLLHLPLVTCLSSSICILLDCFTTSTELYLAYADISILSRCPSFPYLALFSCLRCLFLLESPLMICAHMSQYCTDPANSFCYWLVTILRI